MAVNEQAEQQTPTIGTNEERRAPARELTAVELAEGLEQAIRDVVFAGEAALWGHRLGMTGPAEVELWSKLAHLQAIGHHPTLIVERIRRVVGV